MQEQIQTQEKQISTQKELIQSLQKENHTLRTDVLRLNKIVETQAEKINGMTERIAHLEKNSTTSSKSPSSDINKPRRNQSMREKSDRKPGGQHGHKGSGRTRVENPDIIIRCAPESECKACHQALDMRSGKVVEKRQEIDIPPITPVVTEYQKIQITCSCGAQNNGVFPDNITSNIQMGVRIRSFLIYFNVVQLIPYKRLTDVCADIFGLSVSKGSIENFLETATQKSMDIYHTIMHILKSSDWVGSDETSKKVGIKKWWEWVWQNNRASYYAVENSRGYKVVQKHFGENYEGTLIHDCYAAQNNTIATSGHQLCHPHIQRDLQFLIETYKSKWAYDLKMFLKSAQKARDKIWDDNFSSILRTKIIQTYKTTFSTFLVRSAKENDVLKLQKRMIKHQDSILHFMSSPTIPSHNNSSERAIRMTKVKQKISGCFRSERGAQRHSILLSVIETGKKQFMKPIDTIQSLLNDTLSFSA